MRLGAENAFRQHLFRDILTIYLIKQLKCAGKSIIIMRKALLVQKLHRSGVFAAKDRFGGCRYES